MDDQWGKYADWMREHGLLENTVTQRVMFADRCLREWGTLRRSGGEIGQWLRQYGGWTARTYHAHLRSLYAWMVEDGTLESSPMERMRRPPLPKPTPNPLSANQARDALEAATGERLRAWLLLGMFAGLRPHETAKVRGTDVNETAIRILGKGGQLASVPTHPILWTLAEKMPVDDWWFPSTHHSRNHVTGDLVSLRVREHFRSLGITGSAHRLRATYGTALMREGVNLRLVQELMRHRSLATTEHYLGVELAELAAAIRRLAA